jgi:hypothetical protein
MRNLLVIPCCRMHNFPLKCLKSRDLRPGNIIKCPSGRDQHISVVLDNFSGLNILNCDFPVVDQQLSSDLERGNMSYHLPFLKQLIPFAHCHSMRQLDKAVDAVFVGHAVQIGTDLLCRRVEVRPFWVRLEGILV